MGHAEFNGAIGVVIGQEQQVQRCEFMYDCWRFDRKFCDLTGLQLWYGVGGFTVGFVVLNYPRNDVEAKDSGNVRTSGGEADNLSCGEIYLAEVVQR
jgi:hypothetical protein